MTNKILNQLYVSCKKWKTLVLIGMLLTLGFGQMWGYSVGFENSGNTMTYYSNLNANDQIVTLDRTNGTTTTLDAVTTLYLKGFACKMYQNEDNTIYGGDYQHAYYKVHRTAVEPGTTGYTDVSSWSWNWNSWSSGWRYPTGSKSQNVNLISGLGSGKYSMTYYFTQVGNATWRLPSTSSKYNTLKWTIAVPAVTSGAVTSNGSGSGTDGSPFTVADGSTITFTASGSQASTDANSVLYVKWGDDSYAQASSTTKTLTPTTTKQSMTVKLKYYNSADDLSGEETTLTIYYQSTLTPSIGISSISPSPAVTGDEVTITASRQNAGTANITYQYSLNGTSGWTTIGSATSSTTKTWTVPTITATTTYYFRAQMTYNSTTYTSDVVSITAYGKTTIKVKDTNNWGANFYLYTWGGTGNDWPGSTDNTSNIGTSQWKEVVLYSSSTSFLFDKGTDADNNKTANQTYASMEDSGCYTIASGSGGSLALTKTDDCPSAPTVTTTAAGTVREQSATLGGNVTNWGNDKITSYGYYYSTNSTLSSSNLSVGTRVEVGTNKTTTGTFTKSQTGLTANTKYYVIAYATNGFGTSYGSVINFTTLSTYTVTVATEDASKGTVSPTSVTAGQYLASQTITASPKTNYVFTEWTKSANTITITDATSASTTVKATAAGTVTATFADQWGIFGYGGILGNWDTWCGFPNTGTNTFGTTLTLAKGTTYYFKVVDRKTSTWYGNSNGSGELKIKRTDSGNAKTLSSGGGESDNVSITPDVSGDYTFSFNSSSKALTITFQPAYKVNFGYGTGGSAVTASGSTDGAISTGDYVKAGDDVTFTQTPAEGYKLKGWYTAASGGSAVATMSKSDNVLNSIAATANVYAQYEGNTYTVSFDNNGGSGATPDQISVTYGAAYGTLPAGPTPPGADQFVGWSTTSEGAGTIVTAETLVTTASDHTLYARFEHTYTVTVQYKYGTQTLRASTTVHASETAVAPEITAPVILGYEFVNWTGDNATFADATSATTTVHATAATAITANYTAVPMVYFKNNLDWDNVYVSFDNTWKEIGGKQVPVNKDKPYYKMTQLGTSDIYYCVIPTTYTENDYANWAWNIAFDNTNYGSTAETTHTGTWNEFYGGKFLGRGDFDPSATMYIPYDGDTETRNSGTYYRTGCWMKYNSTDPGYKIYANTYVSGSGGTAVAGTPVLLTADVAGGFEFKGKVYFPTANYSYGFMLHKEYTKNDNDLWYTNTGAIRSTTTSLPWHFYTDGASENGQRCEIHTEAVGDYEFTVTFGTGRPVVNVTYPVGVGDWKLIYKDRATWSNGAHDANWHHDSRVIKAKASTVDTVSFFVAYGSTPSIALYKCTAINATTGAETWIKQSDVALGVSATGIYNYTVSQNASKEATAAFAGSYTGNYYIRTDASDGGWSNYKTSGANTMTYSEYSVTHGGDFGPYSHYFMRHVNSGSNIKFCIANDYSECISDTVVDDTYAHEWIEVEANVRFMWYYGTNKIGRAYVSGSTNVSDRFLVLEGDEHLYDADGNSLTGTHQISGLAEHEMKFIDDQNWVYETTVQANPLERVKLTAKFNNKIQYFYGAEGDRTEATTHQLIGGTGSDKYKMRVVYDFKTNRLVAAWLPSSAVTTEFDIDADVMIIRYHQADAQQITFSGSGKLKDVQTVYGAMQFNKYRLNNQDEAAGHSDLNLSQYERDLFFISFPFDVKLNDVFGFGQYGKHWIIEYYDGKTRAQNGFWVDSPSNWKFVTKAMKDVFTLKANEGYVLALDLDELTMSSSVWDYGVENVYLYFPSTTTIDKIQATSATVDIDQEGYQCTINRNTPDGDRRVKDSYWHLLGVPSYANATNTTSGSWTGTVPNQNPDTWTSSAPYVYSWNGHDNKFGVISSTSTTFKPMQSYLVQYAKPTIEWASVNATPKTVAARRAQNQLRDCEFRLQLMQNDEELDHTFISLREDEEVTAGFDFSYDLSKMLYGAFTSACNVYTLIGEEQAAANCLPLTEQTTVVPVGLKVADDGEYTFSMPDGTNGVGVTLIDGVTGERTNLALTDYTVSLEKGTYDQRFLLEISPIEHTTTAIENSEKTDAPNTVCKKLIDGVLYIIKDGKVFDARGARLQ